MLKGKNVLVGVSGGIAAYKTAILVRRLVEEGASVRVVMTPMAQQFITPLTLATLSQNPVCTEYFNPTDGQWHSHIEMGQWADIFVVAPATATTLAKMAYGIADNLLTTTYLATRCPTLVAPAMDGDMYHKQAVQENIARLQSQGVYVIGPAEGFLASGLIGAGRMEEPEVICDALRDISNAEFHIEPVQKVLITAGGTRERIDPVRYIGNFSSGLMGTLICNRMARPGIEITYVTGACTHKPNARPGVKVVEVSSAQEMHDACLSLWPSMNMGIMSAAVADFRPEQEATAKLKRAEQGLTLQLTQNPDILAALGRSKQKGQWLVGFALETDNPKEHAHQKLLRKNMDLCILNTTTEQQPIFGASRIDSAHFLLPGGKEYKTNITSKSMVAEELAQWATERLGYRDAVRILEDLSTILPS